MKVLITGGHVTTALAVIEELKKHPEIKMVFVGRKYALDGDDAHSFEYQTITNQSIPFIDLTTARLTRVISLQILTILPRLLAGFYQAYLILQKEQPNLILSFGGYLALPIAIVAYCLKRPVYIHEQTMIPGLTNRIIALFAQKIFIAFAETKKYFKGKKLIVSGNPIRQSIFHVIRQPFEIYKTKPVIYITGGSLGSHSINLTIEKILAQLLDRYIIIHQAGNTQKHQDFERLSKIKNKHYFIKKHFYEEEIGYIYSLADLVVGRAGANTIFELIALAKPAILIPLPWSAGGEQKAQAQLLKKKGVAEIFPQNDTAEALLTLIDRMIHNREMYRKNFAHLSHYCKKDASETIIQQILSSN